ncbi:MAG TPA: bifunctional DNA-formamidopyrimidine glycosylase/DNA-(apurinic or apyrimidinic site) lyase [Solirubrobacteraceae bacterium]|nr:bifunctional DNA-formamidopyrimidine glycosylase/DNA-(apurinic or apyrimidinic site) lyase [Solirubrobacteraceae bacterium]
MPELPEVETIRRRLAPRVEGRVFARVEVSDPRWPRPLTPREMSAALTGRRVERLGRRGKYLVWELDGDVFLAQHLRMTGAILHDPPVEPAHARVRIALDDGHRLVYDDPRRFGTGELARGRAALEAFFAARLGPEPFDPAFTPEWLRTIGRTSRAPVKAFLLDQRRVAGVGNIYADEALFRAGVHPLRPARRLTRAQWEAVHAAVIDALSAGIAADGASIDDYRDPDGVRGSFQDEFLVHRRAGEPCPRCGTVVRKLTAAGRGTYVCERCQPRPRRSGSEKGPSRGSPGP